MLSAILHNQSYNESDAEQVLSEYMRIYAPRVARLERMGMERGDVEQELRIALWRAWTRWDGRLSLRRWLSWKLSHKLRDLERALHKKHRYCYPLHFFTD